MASSNRFSLESGRTVEIQQLYFRVSAEGVLEGQSEYIRKIILQSLPSVISKVFWETKATLILQPPPGRIPEYTFIAHLMSSDCVHGQPDGDYSRLIVAWFQDSLSDGLATIAQSALRQVDWDSHAENWVD